jgi:bifunctional N-acetylglucosamine-1-phosphate-uridyltransferase/glucosamine-1-phosphate-acetyltransferase GlmU-like protein
MGKNSLRVHFMQQEKRINQCAVILAGGEATRFKNTAPSKEHKLLIKLTKNLSAIDITIQTLREIGVQLEDIILIVSQELQPVFSQLYPKCIILTQDRSLGNGDAAKIALPELEKRKDFNIVFLIQGDDSWFLKANIFVQLKNKIEEGEANLALVGVRQDNDSNSPISIHHFWHGNVNVQGNLEKRIFKGISNIGQAESTNENVTVPAMLMNAWATSPQLLIENLPTLVPNSAEKHEVILPDLLDKVLEKGDTVYVHVIDRYLGFNTWMEYLAVKQLISTF